ncbi:ATP-binding protein [uncultured Dokdonia sp.]|uniref:GAF domain-containing sensor histidine kinase n=1 Tax=uncultured Dokdonia sp. TaxID=575653 RepID=UPI00263805C7|nr:ATP-binding protein [uncultured Dokdonia sp.]
MKILSTERYEELLKKENERNIDRSILFELSGILSSSHKIFSKNNDNNLKNFKNNLNEISLLISEVLGYDLSLFGYKDGEKLIDLDLFYNKKKVTNNNLEKLKEININESIIGKIINEQNKVYLFESKKENEIINFNFFKDYPELKIDNDTHSNLIDFFSFLKEPLRNLIICPITPNLIDKTSSIGYLILGNKNDFSIDIERIKIEILKNYLFQIFKNQTNLINQNRDYEFISDIYSNHFVYGIEEILEYFTSEFKFSYSSFWVPTKVEDHISFGLKGCYLKNYNEKIKKSCLAKDFYLSRDIVLGEIYNNTIKPNFSENYYLFGNTNSSIPKFKSEDPFFKDKILLIIPITKYIHQTEEDGKINNHLGYFCLYTDIKIDTQNDFLVRLNNFVEQISFYIEHIVYDNSFHVTNLIISQIFNLEISNNEYYNNLAKNINTVLGAEHTSIYFINPENKLYLKSTTADLFWRIDKHNKDEIIEIKKSDIENNPDAPAYTDNESATYRSYSFKKPIIIHDVHSENVKTDLSFYERTKANHKSLILQPILVDEKCIGVIKCINKVERKDSLLKFFTINDEKTLTIIGDFLANQFMRLRSVENQNLFVQKLAHENKTPVQIIWSSLENIEFKLKKDNNFDNNKLKSNFENLAFATSILNNNYSNLNTYLRSKESNLNYHLDVFDFKDKIEDITRFLKPLLQEEEKKTVSVKHNLNKMPSIIADEVKIYQVIYNLLSNAIRYCDSSSLVETFYFDKAISINDDKYFEIQFRNFGIGILEKDMNNIFKEYYRSDEAKIKNPNGTGIGLYVAQTIVNGHGGFIKVTKLEKPTIFSIFLPKNIYTHE